MYFKKRRSNNHFIISALIIVLITIGLVFVLDRRGQKQRYARRFADMKQMQTVLSYHLELYGENIHKFLNLLVFLILRA